MARILASCRLPLTDVVPTLQSAGLLLATNRQGVKSEPGGAPGVLRTDSRKVEPGDCFLAYRGVSSDGHDHIERAVAQGASFLVVEDARRLPQGLSVPWAAVRSGRAAWTALASQAFGRPEAKLILLGVTGTNGKTSTAWMTSQLLAANGVPCLCIGTLGAFLGNERIPTNHTTPDPDALFALFALAVEQGVRVVAMEVSSHAIAQEKLGPLRFDGCAFTSFSRDHLDFHHSMAEYWTTKWRLFTALAKPEARMIFCDGLQEPSGLPNDATALLKGAASALSADAVVYGLEAKQRRQTWAVGHALELKIERGAFTGSTVALDYDGRRLTGEVPYFARHAVENFAASLLLAEKALGRLPPAETWRRLAAVPGRLEQVLSASSGPGVVVDYAHTPDALEKTLAVVRPLAKGKLAVVFGCGGDRDKGKRPLMGAVAARLADRIYVTSDNPRSEEPQAIIQDIVAGVDGGQRASKVVVEPDRAKAIQRAIADAGRDDLIVVAGKGHETYQILKDRTIAFVDREVAATALASLAP